MVDTVQDIDPETKATRFDEPVGIAFANEEKAYVALSSENQIAIVDVVNRVVTGHLKIPAQDLVRSLSVMACCTSFLLNQITGRSCPAELSRLMENCHIQCP